MSGRAEISSELPRILRGFPYPRYYLDFETIQFAIPIWMGTHPYQQLPFQWSCHVEEANGSLAHFEFLDTSGSPPMRPLAERLLTCLGSAGPLISYGHFEKTIIRNLAQMLPDLSALLERLTTRIVDLLPILRTHYYHRDMAGSWSIKAVLPAIAPELNYESLGKVHNGMEAQAAYFEVIDSATTPERRQELTRSMADYCRQDSLAMWEIVRYFSSLV
ncbi:MAG: DUF2779 domain-containing protein [Ignavibacteriales bacterium]|nr:DUF2779 domain-containing protein [Ignavibacteriales bacterium]